MAKYLVTFVAEIYVEVEAENAINAAFCAADNWHRDNVEIIDTQEVELLGEQNGT